MLTPSPERSSEGNETELNQMPDVQMHSFRWGQFEENVKRSYRQLREKKMFNDVTISCENSEVEAHKIVLSTSSDFFNRLLEQSSFRNNPHPIIHIKDLKMKHFKFILEFMYTGEVKVPKNDSTFVLQSAKELEVKGLQADNLNQLNPLIRKANEFSSSSALSIIPIKRSRTDSFSPIQSSSMGSSPVSLQPKIKLEERSFIENDPLEEGNDDGSQEKDEDGQHGGEDGSKEKGKKDKQQGSEGGGREKCKEDEQHGGEDGSKEKGKEDKQQGGEDGSKEKGKKDKQQGGEGGSREKCKEDEHHGGEDGSKEKGKEDKQQGGEDGSKEKGKEDKQQGGEDGSQLKDKKDTQEHAEDNEQKKDQVILELILESLSDEKMSRESQRAALVEKVEKGLYKCKLCEYTSKFAFNVKKHAEGHLPPVEYKCQFCPSVVKNEVYFKNHMKAKHNIKV